MFSGFYIGFESIAKQCFHLHIMFSKNVKELLSLDTLSLKPQLNGLRCNFLCCRNHNRMDRTYFSYEGFKTAVQDLYCFGSSLRTVGFGVP